MANLQKVDMSQTSGTGQNVSRNQRFSAGRIITNAKRLIIAQNAHSGVSPNIDLAPIEMSRSTLITSGQTENFMLWIWQVAFGSDVPKPLRQLSVMLCGM